MLKNNIPKNRSLQIDICQLAHPQDLSKLKKTLSFMVDLTLLHEDPDGDYTFHDRLYRCTGRFACYFLEWTGWYNNRIATRLLGHYRLYQLYKRDPDRVFRSMPLPQAYILHYRSSHIVKYFISRVMSFFYCICTFGRHYLMVEIETFNHTLINDHALILQTFLEQADHDFTSAFRTAMTQLNDRIFAVPEIPSIPPPTPMLIQFHKEDHHYHQTFHSHYSYNHTEINFQPAIQAAHKGKEKDILSKKQTLILFDLLSQTAKLEPIDLGKPARSEAIAIFLHALTGRSKASWTEELHDYKTKNLYAFHTPGELQQLINTISNLAEFLRKAGFRSVATLADKKIRELERHKKDA